MAWEAQFEASEAFRLAETQRVLELNHSRHRADAEVQTDVVSRGVLRSGIHLSTLISRYEPLVDQHGQALATDLVGILRSGGGMLEGGDWAVERLDSHFDSLAGGLAANVSERFRSIGVRGSDARIREQMDRIVMAARHRARLTVLRAISEAKLQRGSRAGVPRPTAPTPLSGVPADLLDRRIVDALQEQAPSAAPCYEQALRDLATLDRVSWRGTATDLREALRDTLDALAPDADVEARPMYRREKGAKGPTMRQKVRFALAKRRAPQNVVESVESVAEAVEEAFAKFVRSVYSRSNVSTHATATRQEVARLQGMVRVALTDLLDVPHG